jgi:phage-related protein
MFLPALLKVTKGLNDMLKKFDKLKQKTTEFFNKIKQTQAFKDFTKNINKIKENVSELFENLKNKNAWDSIVKAKDTFLEINKTVADNLIPRFKELYDTIKPTLVNAFNELKETTDNNKGAFEKLGDFLKSSFTKAIESLSGVWSKFNNTVLKEFLYFCEQLIIPIVKGLYNEFLGLVEFFSTVLSPVFSSVMDILNEKLGGFFETAGNLIHSFTDILTGLLKFLQGTFTGDWDKAWDGIKQLFSGAWLGIQTAFEPIINGIIEKINKAIELMSKIPLLGKGLKDVKISELTPSSAYQTDQKLNFIPNSIKKNTTTNSATTNNITINGARMTDKELANAVKRGITMGAMAR